jgi:hypothetical protein
LKPLCQQHVGAHSVVVTAVAVDLAANFTTGPG